MAGGVARVLWLASRVAVSGRLGLLRQRRGCCACSVATASAACASGPRHSFRLVSLDAILSFVFRLMPEIQTLKLNAEYQTLTLPSDILLLGESDSSDVT
jgi:hypothetical protein